MRLSNPHTEKKVAALVRQGYSRREAMLELTGYDTMGSSTKQRLDFHLAEHTQYIRRHSRMQAGLVLGYSLYNLLPVEDLRNLHMPVRGKPWLRYYDMLPKGMLACDLAALNVYLEEVVGVPPCTFKLLVRQGVWETGEWRYIAKESVLWGTF
jgi:hypothetical protein